MTKFSFEYKYAMVKEIENGKTLSSVCSTYKIAKSYLNYLWRLYKRHGEKGLVSRKHFTKKDKFDLITQVYYGDSIMEVDCSARIATPGILHNWITKYEKLGYNGLETKRGRPPMNNKSKFKPSKKTKLSEKDELKQLKEENLRLRAELDYHKALSKILTDKKSK